MNELRPIGYTAGRNDPSFQARRATLGVDTEKAVLDGRSDGLGRIKLWVRIEWRGKDQYSPRECMLDSENWTL